jgi:hypothetical protein
MPYDTTSLAAGVSSGLDSYFKGLKERKERQKRESDEYDALSTLYEAYGLGSADEAKTKFNLPQLRGTLEGAVVKSAQAKQAKQAALMDEQIAQYQRLGQQRQAQANWMQALGDEFNQTGPTETGEPRGGDALTAAMSATRKVPQGVSPELLTSIMHYGRNAQNADWKPFMEPGTITVGGKTVVYGKSGQFQVLENPPEGAGTPTGTGPVQAQPVLDQDGNPIEGVFQVPGAKGTPRYLNTYRPPKESGYVIQQRKEDLAAVAKIDSEIEALQQRIATEGPDEKRGPNWRWNPLATLSDQLKTKIAERDAAMAKLGPTKPAAGSGRTSTAPVNERDPLGLFP